MTRPVRILHAHSTFSLGGKEARSVRLMNAFGDRAEHVIISAMPDRLGAQDAIERGIKAEFPSDAPPLTGSPTPARLLKLARYMRGFDLVLTYNWGAFDAVMARRMFGGPPLIHHEDGFNEDEVKQLNGRAQPLPPARPSCGLSARRAVGTAGEDRAHCLAARSRPDSERRSRRTLFAKRPSRMRSPPSNGSRARW